MLQPRAPWSTRAGVAASAPPRAPVATAPPRCRFRASGAPDPLRFRDRDHGTYSWAQSTSPKADAERRVLGCLLREPLFGSLQAALHRGKGNVTSIRDLGEIHSRDVAEPEDDPVVRGKLSQHEVRAQNRLA